MTPTPDDSLAQALIDSRLRWRDLAMLAADLCFETDAEGRFTFLAPEQPLGHMAAALLGTPAVALLADPAGLDPFDADAAPQGLRAWLAEARGGERCLEFTAVRLNGGLRGVARDVTEEEQRSEATALALRRATALVRLLGAAGRGRSPGEPADAGLRRLLAGIGPALGADGAALAEASGAAWRILAAVGRTGALPPGPVEAPRLAGMLALAPAGPDLALAVWRDPPPDAEDLEMLAALGPPLAVLQAEAARQRALDEAARTDPLTGLLNRRGFAEALAARRAAQPRGVLAYLDMDGLKRLNDRHGHAAGDAAIRALAARLRTAFGAEGVVARLGGDEFAAWLPAAGPEEAARLCSPLGEAGPLPGLPEAGAEAVAASLGLAEAGAEEAAEALIARADAAMYARKRSRRAA